MVARVKQDLKELYTYIKIGSHNKYWRKILGNNYLPSEHKTALYKALLKVKICDNTIDMLKDVQMTHNVFHAICLSCLYTVEEKEDILDRYKDKVDWYAVYDKSDVTIDFKIKYYKEIKSSYTIRYRGSSESAKEIFKELERDYKINQLLNEDT